AVEIRPERAPALLMRVAVVAELMPQLERTPPDGALRLGAPGPEVERHGRAQSDEALEMFELRGAGVIEGVAERRSIPRPAHHPHATQRGDAWGGPRPGQVSRPLCSFSQRPHQVLCLA